MDVHTLKMFLFRVPHLWGTAIHSMWKRDARFEHAGMPPCRLDADASISSTVDAEGVSFSLFINPSTYYADDDKECRHEEKYEQS